MFRCALILFSCILAGHLAAETVTLASVPAKVRSSNPSLAAARLRIEEARGRLLGSGRLSNPELGVGYLHDSRFGEAKAAVSFEQKFPVTARLRLERLLSQQLVTAAELELRDAERQLIAEAQALAVKLLAIKRQRALRMQQTELAQKLSSFSAGRAAAGEISALDAAQAQVDSQRLLLESNKLETAEVSLIGELKPRLGVAAQDPLSVIGDLPASVMPGRASWERRADYQLALLNEAAARSGTDLAKAKKWEDVTAGILWEGERMEDAPNGLENTGFFGLKLSIPLPFWNKNQGEIAEKSAAAQRAILETKALVAGITNEAAAARAEMEANVKLATETKGKLLPLVLEQTERLENAYKAGQTDLLTVLRAREQRLQLEAAVIDAERDFHLARIRYEAATGQHAPAANPATSRSQP